MTHRTVGDNSQPTDAKVVTAADLRADDPHTIAAALVRANSNGRSLRDRAYGDLIEIVTHAKHLEIDGQSIIELEAKIDAADRFLVRAIDEYAKARDLVPEAILRELRAVGREFTTLAESWSLQRGIEDGGS